MDTFVIDCFHDGALSQICWPHRLTVVKWINPSKYIHRSTAKLTCTVTIYCPVKKCIIVFIMLLRVTM